MHQIFKYKKSNSNILTDSSCWNYNISIYWVRHIFKINFTCFFFSFKIWLLENWKWHLWFALTFLMGSAGLAETSAHSCSRVDFCFCWIISAAARGGSSPEQKAYSYDSCSLARYCFSRELCQLINTEALGLSRTFLALDFDF